jgi:hypothetical protein
VDGDPAHVAVTDFHLAGVNARTDVEAEPAYRVDDGRRTSHRSGRPIERREEPVARGLDLTSAPAVELASDGLVVAIDEPLPCTVTDLDGACGRSGDVGEQHGREHAVGFGPSAGSGQEVLDLVRDRVGVAGPHQVVVSR